MFRKIKCREIKSFVSELYMYVAINTVGMAGGVTLVRKYLPLLLITMIIQKGLEMKIEFIRLC